MTEPLDVKSLGAAGDGASDDAPAIQKALDRGGLVFIPPGHYRVASTLRVRSRTRLEAHPQATLRLADGAGTDAGVFLLTNADHDGGDRDIEVRGGVWHGNNRHNPRTPGAVIDPGSYTGVLINFKHVTGLTFADALLRDPETYHFRATKIERFVIEDIRFHSTNPRPNNDGIHLAGFCHHGIIRRIRGLGPHAPSDDLIALNADDAVERIEGQGKLRGPITDVVVHDLAADQCHSFVRVLSVDSPIERIDVRGVRGGCTQSVLNMDGARGCRVQVFDANDPKYARGVGVCRDIRLSDVEAWVADVGKPRAMIRLQQRTRGLRIERFRRVPERDGSPATPTIEAAFLPDHELRLETLDHTAAGGVDESVHALRYEDRLSLNPSSFRRLTLTGGD